MREKNGRSQQQQRAKCIANQDVIRIKLVSIENNNNNRSRVSKNILIFWLFAYDVRNSDWYNMYTQRIDWSKWPSAVIIRIDIKR